MRNKRVLRLMKLSSKNVREFLLNENAIERIDETLIKFVVQTSKVTMKYLRSINKFTS